MRIVFDLDYTLLDTTKFKEALADAITSCGVSRQRYEETYSATVRRDGKTFDYDPEIQLEALIPDFPSLDARALAHLKIDDLLRHTERFLFPGAVELLRALRRAGNELILLTLGNESWQRAKVEHSGLAELFDKVVTTGKHKHAPLRDLVPEGERAIIVNDNGAETKELMAQMPWCEYILVRGPKGAPDDLHLPEVVSMSELTAHFQREGILTGPLPENLPSGFRR